MPAPRSAVAQRRVQLVRQRLGDRLARALERLADEPPVGAAGVEQSAPGMDFAGRRTRRCHSTSALPVRSFHHAEFPADRLRAERVRDGLGVRARRARRRRRSPASSRRWSRCARRAWSTRSLVLDDDSRDGTGAIAAALGAEVVRPAALLPEFGPVLGKGDAMWRALSVLTGDVVCFVDADSEDFGAHFATRAARPAGLRADGVQFVKGFYRRPFKSADDQVAPTGGGRVTELTARPLLAALLSRAGRRPPAAGRRDRRAPRAARAAAVLHRLRGRDRAAARRRTRGRDRRDRAGRPRRAPEPPPAARRTWRRWPTRCSPR